MSTPLNAGRDVSAAREDVFDRTPGNPALARILQGAFLLLVCGCAMLKPSRPANPTSIATQLGPIMLEVHGVAGGLTNSELTRLVTAGIKQGCRGGGTSGAKALIRPSLSMVWDIQTAGARPPSIIIIARLLSAGRPVSFAFDRTIPPDAAPDVVFEYATAGVSCALFRKASYFTPAHRKGLPVR